MGLCNIVLIFWARFGWLFVGLNCFTVSSGFCFVVYGCEFVGCWLCKLMICLCALCFGLGLVCG